MIEATKNLLTCEVPGCINRSGGIPSFVDPASFKRPMRRHDSNANLFICGHCDTDKKRRDSLLDHLRKKHELPNQASPVSCLSCSHPMNNRRQSGKEIIFATKISLEKHLAENHKEVQASLDGTSTSDFAFSAHDAVKRKSLDFPTSILSIADSSAHSSAARFHDSTSWKPSLGVKHPLQPEPKPPAKRGKFEHSKNSLTHAPGGGAVSAISKGNIQNSFAGTVDHLIPDLQIYEEIRNVGVLDVLSLFKLHSTTPNLLIIPTY